MEKVIRKKGGWRKVGRIFLKTLMWIFLLIIVLFLLILTPPVQNFITGKATNFLEKKIKTRVEIGRLFITLGGKIALDDVYIEDQQKDTLLSAGMLRVNINFYKLLFKDEVDVESFLLEDATAKIRRELPDTSFNFQYIIDAFDTGEKDTTVSTDSSTTVISIGTVELNRVRFVYKDIVSGNDVTASLGHFDTRVEKFDLNKLHFIVPQVNLQGLNAKLIMSKPLEIPDEVIEKAKIESASTASPGLKLELGELSFQKSSIDYRDSVGLTYATAGIGNLNVRPRTLDLSAGHFDFGDILLENTNASVRQGKTAIREQKEKESGNEKESVKENESGSGNGLRLALASLGLKNVTMKYDDDNSSPVQTGMDYSHIDANIQNFEAKDFLFANDSIKALIANASIKEKSGLDLQQLQTSFLYSNNQAYLNDLYLKTPGTELKRRAAIRYTSMDALKEDIGSMQLDLQLENSQIAVSDILRFVPALKSQPAFSDPTATWFVNSDIKGSVANMQIAQLQIRGLSDTRVDISGTISGMPDMEKSKADLTIRELNSSRRDLNLFLPKGTLPSTITLPNRLNISGRLKGGMQDLNTDLSMKTDLGNARIKGSMKAITDPKRAVYDVTLNTQALQLGKILQDTTLGPLTADIAVKGTGFDPKVADADFKGVIQSMVYKGYNYRDLVLDGSIAQQQAQLAAGMQDPNIHFAIDLAANLAGQYPAVQLNAVIDSIKLQALHLSPNQLIYRGNINADFPVTNPDSLEGTLFITKSLLVQNDQRILMDTVQLIAGATDSSRFVNINSDFMSARLQGKYKLTELGTVIQRAIEPYFSMTPADSAVITGDPYDFTLNATIINGPVIQSFVPDLKRLDSISLKSRFSDQEGWQANLTIPAVEMGANSINGFELNAGTNESAEAINILATIQQLKSGSSIQLDNTTLTAKLQENVIDFNLNIKEEDRDKFNIGGLFKQPAKGEYAFSLKPSGLVLNYEAWTIAPENSILVKNQSINASNFQLIQGSQQLSIQSVNETSSSPLEVAFKDFHIATLTAFVQNDSTLIDGTINGKAVVENVMVDPVFTSDLTVTDLSIKNDTVGNVAILVNNQSPNTFAADVTISGRGNDVKLTGSYFTNSSSFDMLLDIRKLPLTTAQAMSAGAIREASGDINGQFKVTGTVENPSVNGELNFNKAAFNLAMLNNYLRIDQEKIQVNQQGFSFNRFEIKDSANNALTLNGTAATTNFTNYNFDLAIRSNNFRALNSTKKDNDIFYGQLYFNSNLKITGTEKAPVIDGTLKVNEKTKMTVVLPQGQPGVADREGIVEFVDMDAPPNDSLFLASYDSLNSFGITGAAISVNLEIDKAADLTLVVDEGNGDFLNVKGEALLNATVDPSGEIILAGTYDLEEGAYELSFNAIRRKFLIQKGSKITWGGAPTDAIVDISAKYIANTAPLDLVKGQLGEDVAAAERNTYLQKLPFEVLLKMEGKLLKPDISFDILLPDNKSYIVSNDIVTTVRTKLDQLRTEEGEMNKQVFALLLLNRFVAENPFNSSTSITAGTLARQSVSKLMTEQLNRLADDLVKGVDLNFDVQSSEDYTTGQRADRTDLNVGLSKQLLNDRLTVTVGSNFELEGPPNSNQQSSNLAGNIALNYRLSEDGRYQLRAYRKNEYQGVIDGYIIETGVGFIITLDYNKLREIFQKKKIERERQKRREERRKKALEDEKTAPADSTNTPPNP